MELTITVLIVAAVVGFIVYSRKRSRKGGAGDDIYLLDKETRC